MTSARAIARDALVRIESGAHAHVLLPGLLRASGLDVRDRALVTDMVFGTVRMQRRLDELVEIHSRRRLTELDAPARAALRLGAYQLLAGTPPHAAVSEAVTVTPRRARAYVNAVLRALAASGPPWPAPSSEAVALSYPDWLVTCLSRELGDDDARAALMAMNERPAVSLRPNPARTSPSALITELRAAGADAVPGTLVRDAVLVRGAGDLAALPAVAEGRATPQDQASQAVVAYLAPRAGERILDVAAAPGGKATAIAERVGEYGLVAAADARHGRLGLVGVAAARLGLANIALLVADGRRPAVRPHMVDRVLVDAPCSGLGVLRRRADARWRVQPEALPALAELQLALLLAAAAAVRSGGVLVYAVCTLTAMETTGVAQCALDALPGFAPLAAPPPPWRPRTQGALLLPQDAGTDGMYVLALRRDG